MGRWPCRSQLFGPGTGSQEWSDSARGAALRSPDNLARDWGEVFGIIARTLWHGDCVVVHCMAGRHRAALLVCVTLTLLRGTSLAATETWMLTRRQIELNEVRSRDP